MNDSPAAVIVDASGTIAAVKPANTAPLATDPSLVVSLSPNSEPIPTANASVGATGAAAPADATQIGGPDGGGLLQAAEVRTADPAGTEKALVVRNIPSGTQPVSAASLPLPAGAATEATLGTLALETSLQTLIADVVARLGTLGQKNMAGSAPVVIASDQSAVAVTGPLTDTQLRASPVPVSGTVTSNIGTTGGLALDSSLTTLISDLTARLNTLGQKTMANSAPVVIASDQSAIPITGSITASNPSVGSNNAAIPGSSTQIGGSDGTNLQAARVYDINTAGGTEYALGVQLRQAASGGSVEVGTDTHPLRVDPTGTTPQTIKQAITLYSQTNVVSEDTPVNVTLDVTAYALLRVELITDVTGASASCKFITSPGSFFERSRTLDPGGQEVFLLVTGPTFSLDFMTGHGIDTNLTINVTGFPISFPGEMLGVSETIPTQALTTLTRVAGTVAIGSLPLATDAATNSEQVTQTSYLALSQASLALLDDVPAGMNAAFSKGNPAMGQLDDAGTTAATENNVAPVRITAQRAMHMNLRNNAGTEVGISGSALRVDPVGTTAQPVTDNAGSLTVDTPQLPAALVSSRLDVNNGAWLGSTAPTVGQKAMASSLPVVIASDQTAVTTVGNKTNNAAAPGATNLGALSALANAADPSWSEGNLVLESVDLAGYLRARSIIKGGQKGTTNTYADITHTAEGSNHEALDVQLYHGGSAIDPTNIRALTSADFISMVWGDRSYIDAFGRLRVAQPQTIFDSKQISDSQPLFWDDAAVSGSGTSSAFRSNESSTRMSVSNATAGLRVRQTFRQFNYQPGKSQLIFMTWVNSSAPVAGIVRGLGQGNANNGLFFEANGTTLQFVRRTFTSGSAVDTTYAQSTWNLDKLDGTGASGLTLDTTKTNIFVIDYEWLGVGSIRFGFVLNGKIIYAHQVNNANNLTLVYMQLPNLPLRYYIQNTGAGPAASMDHICSTVITEGGRDISELGINFSVDRGTTPLTTLNNANLYPVVAMRLRSGYTHAQVIPTQVAAISTTANTSLYWQLVLNPTITGTALSYSTVTNSAIEAAAGATNATTVSAGTILASGYTNTGQPVDVDLRNDLAIGVNIAGTADVLVLAVARLTGTTPDLFGSVTWHEAQ